MDSRQPRFSLSISQARRYCRIQSANNAIQRSGHSWVPGIILLLAGLWLLVVGVPRADEAGNATRAAASNADSIAPVSGNLAALRLPRGPAWWEGTEGGMEKRLAQLQPSMPLAAPPEGRRAVIAAQYGKLPLSFEVNEGQTDGRVKFFSRGSGYSLFLTKNEAVMTLKKALLPADLEPTAIAGQPRTERSRKNSAACAVIRMGLAGANGALHAVGDEELPGKANYFIGNDPAKWRTNVPTYAKVKYAGVYPGVDLMYYGNQGRLEYDFVVAPGADPHKIRLKFRGAGKLNLDEQGRLVLATEGADVHLEKPEVYQVVAGKRKPVESSYALMAGNNVGFRVGEYDGSRPLVIDPVLAYSTYLGGSSADAGNAIAVDSAGSAYVTGSTGSNFPTANSFQTTFGGVIDVFITKLNPSGSALVYSTYLGGSDYDEGYGIAVDSVGSAYVAGYTQSTNFPTTTGSFQPTYSFRTPTVFVTKLSPGGSALVYSTYLGVVGDSNGRAIAVDSAGNAYVTGDTDTTNFPTTSGAFQPSPGGVVAFTNAFITKLNASGTGLVYSTYLGGSNRDFGKGIAVDSTGNAYVTGVVNSTNFPTFNALQAAIGGSPDAFVAKLNSAGSALIYSTYLGGSSGDFGQSIAADSSGNAYVTGCTSSTNFPTASPFQPTFKGTFCNAFVTKFNPTGSALIYSTYLGGTNQDRGQGIAVDSAGNAYVTGSTSSTDFPISHALQPVLNGTIDAFISELNASGSALIFSTYLGGSTDPGSSKGDFGNGIAVDANSNVYVAGTASSSDFPTSNALQATSGGGQSAVVVKISPAALPHGDFSGSFDHGTASAIPGGQATYGLTVTPSGGFTSDVALSVSNLPPGVTGGFSPSVVTGGSGTSTLTISTSSTTPPGTYDFTVTGVSGPLAHSTTLRLLLGTVDFTGSITPTYQAVAPGGSAQSVVTLHTVGTLPFNNTVTLSIDGLPAGVTALFNPPTVNPDANGSSTLTLTTTSSTAQGSYQLRVSGTGGGQFHFSFMTLAISNPSVTGDFSGLFNHGAASANPGGQAIYGLTVTPSGGFNGNVVLTASNTPSGTFANFSPTVVVGGSGTSTLSVTTSTTTPRGIYYITATGSSGSLTHSTTLTLLVGAVDFTGTITPDTQTVTRGQSAQYTITLSNVGTMPFGGSVALSISGLPPGVTGSFSNATISPDTNGSSVLTLTTTAATPVGTYTPIVTGTGGGVTHSKAVTLTVQ